MKTLVVVTLTMTALGCSSLSIAADDCRFTADRGATVAVGDAAQAKIVARAGKLEMQGRPDLNEVRIRGKACASGQDVLGRIELVAERRGNEIFIEAKLPELGRWFSNASLDLEIDVPETLALDVEDSSGSVDIRGTGPLRLKDGSGGVDIEGIAGGLFVHDGSGSIEIKGVEGDVELEDGSGGFSVTDVGGSVEVRDGSGSLRIRRVAGDVTVTRDGSGSISVSQVEGDFTVERDGSGSVHYEDIGGRVSVSD